MKSATKRPDKLQLKSTQCRIDLVDGCALSLDKYLASVDVSTEHLSVPIIILSSNYTLHNLTYITAPGWFSSDFENNCGSASSSSEGNIMTPRLARSH